MMRSLLDFLIALLLLSVCVYASYGQPQPPGPEWKEIGINQYEKITFDKPISDRMKAVAPQDFRGLIIQLEAANAARATVDPFAPVKAKAKDEIKANCGCAGPDCDCGTNCQCGETSCSGCPCKLYWANDEDGGYFLCTKTRVIGKYYLEGFYRRREVHEGYETWTKCPVPIDPPARQVIQAAAPCRS